MQFKRKIIPSIASIDGKTELLQEPNSLAGNVLSQKNKNANLEQFRSDSTHRITTCKAKNKKTKEKELLAATSAELKRLCKKISNNELEPSKNDKLPSKVKAKKEAKKRQAIRYIPQEFDQGGVVHSKKPTSASERLKTFGSTGKLEKHCMTENEMVVERTQPDLSMRQTVKAIKPKVEEKLARVVSASLRNNKSPNARMTFDSAEKSKDKSRYPKKDKESKDKLKEPLMVVMHKEKDGEKSKTNRKLQLAENIKSSIILYSERKGSRSNSNTRVSTIMFPPATVQTKTIPMYIKQILANKNAVASGQGKKEKKKGKKIKKSVVKKNSLERLDTQPEARIRALNKKKTVKTQPDICKEEDGLHLRDGFSESSMDTENLKRTFKIENVEGFVEETGGLSRDDKTKRKFQFQIGKRTVTSPTPIMVEAAKIIQRHYRSWANRRLFARFQDQAPNIPMSKDSSQFNIILPNARGSNANISSSLIRAAVEREGGRDHSQTTPQPDSPKQNTIRRGDNEGSNSKGRVESNSFKFLAPFVTLGHTDVVQLNQHSSNTTKIIKSGKSANKDSPLGSSPHQSNKKSTRKDWLTRVDTSKQVDHNNPKRLHLVDSEAIPDKKPRLATKIDSFNDSQGLADNVRIGDSQSIRSLSRDGTVIEPADRPDPGKKSSTGGIVPRMNFDIWNKFAKEEYKKWGTVKTLLHIIEGKMGGKAADEVQDLFKQLETFAECSKQNLREAFLKNEAGLSNQPSDARSMRLEGVGRSGTGGSSFFDRKMAMKLPQLGEWNEGRVSPLSKRVLEVERDSVVLQEDSPLLSKKAMSSKRSSRAFVERWVDPPVPVCPVPKPSPCSAQLEKGSNTLKTHFNFYDPLREAINFENHLQTSAKRTQRRSQKPTGRVKASDEAISLCDEALKIDKNNKLQSQKSPPQKKNLTILSKESISLKEFSPELIFNGYEESIQDLEVLSKECEEPAVGLHAAAWTKFSEPIIEDGPHEISEELHETQSFLNMPLLKKYIDPSHNLFDFPTSPKPQLFYQGIGQNDPEEDNLSGLVSDDILDLLVEEALSEYQEVRLRKLVCPQETPRCLQDADKSKSRVDVVYGIRTNYNAINEYLTLLVDYLLDSFAERLIERFNSGVSYNPRDVIRILREKEISLYSGGQEQVDHISPEQAVQTKIDSLPLSFWQDLPITPFLEDDIYNSLRAEVMNNFEEDEQMSSLFKLQTIYHKSIFDCFNEIVSSHWQRENVIDYVRLVSFNKQNPTKKIDDRDDLECILVHTKEVTLEYASIMCGMIRDKEDSIMGNLRNLDLLTVGQIREERLIRMLAIEVYENEKYWTTYSKEELISLIDTADKICEDMVGEVVQDLLRIGSRTLDNS